MKPKLSLSMITLNAEETLARTLDSVQGLVNEIVIIDSYSTDKTVEIAKKYKAKIYTNKYIGEGTQRNLGLDKVSGDWVLVLDDDEVVSPELKEEILEITNKKQAYNGFKIPYQNFFLGKPISHGGEYYEMLRLFKKEFGVATNVQVHSQYQLKTGEVGLLKNKIHHYSYRSISQLFKKFTDYSFREARKKLINGEKTSLKKITMYPAHMFWARFVEDKGYKDGLFRIPLDLAFAYMEFLTYFLMFFLKPV